MDLPGMIEGGGANPLLLVVFALALGALHGLEPGHSKTMMAAYIVAVHGTVKQAVLLGVSAALSHSVIVWILAAFALVWGNEMIGEELEPWFMTASGILVLGIAGWMFWQAMRTRKPAHHHHHHHDHGHTHSHPHDHDHRTGGRADAHARAHAEQIRVRLSSGRTGTWQTILFGLSGGLIPCPAAITVFILCLHLGKVAQGVALVGAFSVGLAVTLVTVGSVAALGLQAVSSRTSRFDRIMALAPWLSPALIAVIGLLMIWSGANHLSHSH